jgi:elongator complex protein 3
MKPLSKKNEMRKPTKTIAGVTPLAVMLKPRKCKHGVCLYCPSLEAPQSYTPKSPAVLRAIMLNYSASEQVKARLKSYEAMGHNTDKIELIIMGGTFLSYPLKYQYEFVKECYDALNEKKSVTLEGAKKINETAKHRVVALCIETRPDICSKKEIKRMLEFGCTRVELGVQAISDEIYKKNKRGHKVQDVIDATKLLKDSGFKVGYHIMPGLYGSNPEKDLKMFEELFENQNFKPDQLKIYPCQVINGSELSKLYYSKQYNPYPEQQIKELIKKMLKIVPGYCRVMRIMRELPPEYLICGTKRIDLRKDIDAELKEENIALNEIRSREIGFILRDKIKVNRNLKLNILAYPASQGQEYFISTINKDNILFGLCRLRFPSQNIKPFIPELKDCVIIRELHVYGKVSGINNKKVKESVQHQGLGKQLMKTAENLAIRNGFSKIAVISGVGVREYYRKLGYKLIGEYMIKEIG